MVGLAFTALQVVTVGAQTTAPAAAPGSAAAGGAPMGDPCMVTPAGPDRDACYAAAPGSAAAGGAPMGTPGTAAPMGTPGTTAPMGTPGTTAPGDPSCAPLANGTLPPHCK